MLNVVVVLKMENKHYKHKIYESISRAENFSELDMLAKIVGGNTYMLCAIESKRNILRIKFLEERVANLERKISG